ncbi:hypothetical protein GALMADRAFT_222138 [Galerina marginata CBS 339.88]|uniref:Uncharacterized protein n=1 Tax=Galerina marginata (strain CBS 339.88) TaxID=685588 RepID=A0A067TNK8_GALM3|nr:hypothetical protein GALMADRAFT_222138 [Galerina marginata CBS 339.88]
MPSTKFTQPRNGDVFAENTGFTVTIATTNLNSGISVNPQENYMSAPQQVSNGNILGHYHLVIEQLSSFSQTSVTDPKIFTLFKEIFTLSTDVAAGLPAGSYRMTVTVHAANHQPVLVPMSQHGTLGDAVYFTVTGKDTRDLSHLLNPWERSFDRLSAKVVWPNSPWSRKKRRIPVPRQSTGDDQTSLTLNPSVIAPDFAKDGQDNPQPGQTASLTSTNNFINYCATLSPIALTNGQQITTESCNPAPMGILPSSDNMPSVRFTQPSFNSTLPANTLFAITLAVSNLGTAQFANSATNYLAAPQQLNSAGQIQGYVAIVIESMSSMDQTTPTNPQIFAFAKSITVQNTVGGALSTNVTSGLPPGVYRLSSRISTANHQPVLTPISQHGSLDDIVYFTVGPAGSLPPNGTSAPIASSVGTTSSSTTSSTAGSIFPVHTSEPSRKNSKIAIGLGVGVSLGAIIIVVLLFLLWRIRKARNSKLKAGVVDEVVAMTPFTDEPPNNLPSVYRISAYNPAAQKSKSNSDSQSNSTTRLIPDSLGLAGPSKQSRQSRRSETLRPASSASLAPSYHTTLETPGT